jgi:hypothetical protein
MLLCLFPLPGDGISEGQFYQVLLRELHAIPKACASFGSQSTSLWSHLWLCGNTTIFASLPAITMISAALIEVVSLQVSWFLSQLVGILSIEIKDDFVMK